MIWYKLSENHAGNSPLLGYTREITDIELKGDKAWSYVYKGYVECQGAEWATKATVSVVNSILFHRKKYFIITRESLKKLLQNDTNWEPRISLKNENYTYLLSRLHCGLIEKFEELMSASGRKLTVYKLTDPEVSSYFDSNDSGDLFMCRDYAKDDKLKKGYNLELSKEEETAIYSLIRKNNPEEYSKYKELSSVEDPVKVEESEKLIKKLYKKELNRAKKDRSELDGMVEINRKLGSVR
jgi:hypothetical protein